MPKRTYPDQAGLQYRGLGDGIRCMRRIIPDYVVIERGMENKLFPFPGGGSKRTN